MLYPARDLGVVQTDGSVLYPQAMQLQYPQIVAEYESPEAGLQYLTFAGPQAGTIYQVKGLYDGGVGGGMLLGAGIGGLAGGLAGGPAGLAAGMLGGAAIGGLAGGLF